MDCMGIAFSKSPVVGYQVKSGLYIDTHLERCALVQMARLHTLGKYVNWNFKNIIYRSLIPTFGLY